MIRAAADCRQHGKRGHHQRDVAVPSCRERVPLQSRPDSFSSVPKPSSMVQRRPAAANGLNSKSPKKITSCQPVWPTPQLPSREPLMVLTAATMAVSLKREILLPCVIDNE